MKALATAFSVLLTAGVAFAQSTSTPPATGQSPDMSGDKAKAAKEFTAQVVSMDTDARTITVKKTGALATDADAAMTLSVDTKADSSLKKVKAGDQVKLVCKTDASGKEIVSKIDKVDTRPASDAPPNP